MGPGKVFSLCKQLFQQGVEFLVFGSPTTSGVQLKLESGDLAVREGDDSAYANLKVKDLTVSGTTTGVTAAAQMVVVTRGTTQTLTTGVAALISWTAEVRDDLGISTVGAGAATKVATFTTAAVWDAKATIEFNNVAGGVRFVYLQLCDSGDNLIWRTLVSVPSTGATFGNVISLSETLRVSVGDYLQVAAYQDSGGDVTLGSSSTHCSLTRLGT